jgi:hypothetical protein
MAGFALPSLSNRTTPTLACHLAVAMALTLALIVLNVYYSPRNPESFDVASSGRSALISAFGARPPSTDVLPARPSSYDAFSVPGPGGNLTAAKAEALQSGAGAKVAVLATPDPTAAPTHSPTPAPKQCRDGSHGPKFTSLRVRVLLYLECKCAALLKLSVW